jgi:hypothetical protein
MKLLIFTVLIFVLIIPACKDSDNNPVEPEPEKKYMFLEGYGSLIDSFYYLEGSNNEN